MPKRIALHRAKVLTAEQFDRALKWAKTGANPLRDEVILRLSFYTGMRAKEIAGLRWKVNVLDSSGKVDTVLHVTHDIGKRSVERDIPLSKELRSALVKLRKERPDDVYVVHAADGSAGPVKPNTLVQWFRRFYANRGFVGVSSHSGRRTFITNTARIANLHGASIRDVQLLAGHRRLETTAEYIEPSTQQRALVANVFG